MRRLLTLSVAVSFIAIGICEGRADGWEVNNIWWNLILNYNNSGADVCVAKQYNSQPLAATFDIYPALTSSTPVPKPYLHQKITQVMQPYIFYRMIGWLVPDQTPVPPQCTLVGWQFAGAKGVRVRPQDVQKR
jgi:hypothetical protein